MENYCTSLFFNRRHTMRKLFFFLLFVVTGIFPCHSKQMGNNLFDDSAMTKLITLMDSITARNAGYERVIAQLDTLSRENRMKVIVSLRGRNANDSVLRTMIDELLALEPYQTYFSRFRNVTPADFRLAFNTLPYVGLDSPGSIAETFYELIHHRNVFQEWYRTIRGKIDIQRCVTAAREWLPKGEYPLNKIYFIYDGNAGSFAEQGCAFFNLCSEVVSKMPREKRFKNMDEVNIGVLEGVIAHELNHVMAEPILFPAGRTFTSWEDRWKDRITRNIVSEGVAFRCNPITGFQKNLSEDRATIVSLLKELNGKLLSLDRHELQENDVREWYGKLFQEFAASLLKQYLQKTYPDSAVKTLAVQNSVFRPDLVHALGWWMVSRITENGVKKEKAIELLTNPASLYELYNKTLERGMDDVAVDARVVAMFSKH